MDPLSFSNHHQMSNLGRRSAKSSTTNLEVGLTHVHRAVRSTPFHISCRHRRLPSYSGDRTDGLDGKGQMSGWTGSMHPGGWDEAW